jgi:acetyl esterase/lipase
MDYSRLAAPSKSWKALIAVRPEAADEGHTGNDPTQAAELRARVNSVRETVTAGLIESSGLQDQVKITTVQVPSRDEQRTIPVRQFVPRGNETGEQQSRGLVYFHGGGFLIGSETLDDFICANIALDLGVTVLSIIYRHTPKHAHPAQVDDAWDAFEYIRSHASDFNVDIRQGLGVMGESAGGALAASVVFRHMKTVNAAETTDKAMPQESAISGVLLSIPWLMHPDSFPWHLFASPDVAARIQCQNAPVLPGVRLKMFSDLLAAPEEVGMPFNVPFAPDTELRKWPRTSFIVTGMDPLRDDGLLFAKKLDDLQ